MANPVSIPPAAHENSSSWEGAEFLEFERDHWGHIPGKEEAVYREFGIGLAAYYHQLHGHCRSRGALIYDAHLTRAILDAADSAVSARLSPLGGDR